VCLTGRGSGSRLEPAGLGGGIGVGLTRRRGRGALGLAGGCLGGTLGPGSSGNLRTVGLGQGLDRLTMGSAADEVGGLGDGGHFRPVVASWRRSNGHRRRGDGNRGRQQSRCDQALHGMPQLRIDVHER
jgi:hypothetical protein